MLGDTHGTIVHLFERDCSIQRRNQKVVERAPAPYLRGGRARELCDYALKIAPRRRDYVGAGTVEFLMDADTGEILLHRGQSAHPGRAYRDRESSPASTSSRRRSTSSRAGASARRRSWRAADRHPTQAEILMRGHALQCRITTENPEQQLHPGLWPHHRLSRRHRLRHPPRRRHRLFGRRDHPLLRSAAREGDGLGARRRRRRSPAWTGRCASSASAASRPI